MSEYDLLVGLVEAEPGRHTAKALARLMVLGHGGDPKVHARRIQELVKGKALLLQLNPHARQRKNFKRLYPGTATVATALAYEATAPDRAASRVHARTGTAGEATPHTPTASRPEPPTTIEGWLALPKYRDKERHFEMWLNSDEVWWGLTIQERLHWHPARAERELRRSGTGRSALHRLARPMQQRPIDIYPDRSRGA